MGNFLDWVNNKTNLSKLDWCLDQSPTVIVRDKNNKAKNSEEIGAYLTQLETKINSLIHQKYATDQSCKTSYQKLVDNSCILQSRFNFPNAGHSHLFLFYGKTAIINKTVATP